MQFELTDRDQKILNSYTPEVHLKKLLEEMGELKQASEKYLKTGEDEDLNRFVEEFTDVAIKMRHVYVTIIRRKWKEDLCGEIEDFKLARQVARISLYDESFGSNKGGRNV